MRYLAPHDQKNQWIRRGQQDTLTKSQLALAIEMLVSWTMIISACLWMGVAQSIVALVDQLLGKLLP